MMHPEQALNCGAQSKAGGYICDRARGHEGPHRSYNEQYDEPVFWGLSDYEEVVRLREKLANTESQLTVLSQGITQLIAQWTESAELDTKHPLNSDPLKHRAKVFSFCAIQLAALVPSPAAEPTEPT